MKRNETRKIQIGQISIGGSEHVVIQSMCSIKTSKIEEVSAQINRCASLGAELMRCSVLDFEDAEAFKEIKKRSRDHTRGVGGIYRRFISSNFKMGTR